ncbi:MAG: glycosyltransferase family 1 protein, partial [Oscillospiraceae bacterium]
MNIAIDVQPLVSPCSKNRGIGNYNVDQLKLLVQKDTKNKYIFFNIYNNESIFDILEIDQSKFCNIVDVHIYTGNTNYIIQKSSNGLKKEYDDVLGKIIKKFLSDNSIDLFYFTSPFDYYDYYNMEWFEGVYTMATVYDVIPFLFQNRYLNHNQDLKKWYMRIIEFVKQIDKLLVISESVKTDLVKHLSMEPDKIDVIYAGIDKRYKKIINIEDEKEIRDRYKLYGKFIMCTGGADPRKNMNELIHAYSNLSKNLKDEYLLAVVCSLHPEGEQELRNTADKYKVSDRVILTKFIPFDHLLKLYNMSSLMAFPSQYEGFGLPVIEAMACGTPVLTSNNSSLGEIAENAAVLVDPFSITSISRGLSEALGTDMVSKYGLEMQNKVDLYTWENCVNLTINSINTVQLRKDFEIDSNCKRNKIAFFTPLPPLKSGISDYSYDILIVLNEYFDIDVYIDDGYSCDKNLFIDTKINIINHKQYTKNRHNYSDTVYQVGNSQFHTYMFKYIKKYSGTVVLHDYNLHGVINFMSASKGDLNLYQELLSEDNKDIAKQYLDDINVGNSGFKIHDIESNGIVTNYASKIIVHSDYSKEKLLERDIGRNVMTIPSCVKIERNFDKALLREKYNINKDDFIFASFGFVAETKRVH